MQAQGLKRDDEAWLNMPSLLMSAHELKAPLVLIRQLALQLEEGMDHQSVERIRLTSERSLRLVEALTRSARLEDSLFATEPVSVDVFYGEVVDELRPLAAALGQDIAIKLPRRALTVVANPILLRTIIFGLCDNALTHNRSDDSIVLTAKRQGGRIELGVRDFGQSTASLKQLSHQLGRTLSPLSGRPRSSGLGLMIAQRFAQQMEAELGLKRHRQAGATFSLAIPESKQLSLI